LVFGEFMFIFQGVRWAECQ